MWFPFDDWSSLSILRDDDIVGSFCPRRVAVVCRSERRRIYAGTGMCPVVRLVPDIGNSRTLDVDSAGVAHGDRGFGNDIWNGHDSVAVSPGFCGLTTTPMETRPGIARDGWYHEPDFNS